MEVISHNEEGILVKLSLKDLNILGRAFLDSIMEAYDIKKEDG